MRHPMNDDAAKLIAELDTAVSVDLADPHVFAQMRSSFDGAVGLMRGQLDTSRFAVSVHDTVLESSNPIPVRIYEPAECHLTHTCLIYFHGGGWNMGTLDTLDPEMRWFTHRLGVTIMSVDYRLAPEHAYPAALDDCMAVVRRMAERDPGTRIALAGDSAGGNLAAAVSLMCRDEGIPIVGQLLLNPALDASQSGASYSEFAEGYGLTRVGMEFNWSTYLQTVDAWTDPYASPSGSADLSGVAPAVIVTAGYDPLCDDGVAYVKRLLAAGVSCVHLHLPGMPHGFVVMSGRVPAITDAIEQFLYHFFELLADNESTT